MAENPLFTLYRGTALTWLDQVQAYQATYFDQLTRCQTAYLDFLRACLGQPSTSPISDPVTQPDAAGPELDFRIDQVCENTDPASLWIESPSRAKSYVATDLTEPKSGGVIPADHVVFTLRSGSPQTLFVALVDLQPLLSPEPQLAANGTALAPGVYSGQILDGQNEIATINVELTTVPC